MQVLTYPYSPITSATNRSPHGAIKCQYPTTTGLTAPVPEPGEGFKHASQRRSHVYVPAKICTRWARALAKWARVAKCDPNRSIRTSIRTITTKILDWYMYARVHCKCRTDEGQLSGRFTNGTAVVTTAGPCGAQLRRTGRASSAELVDMALSAPRLVNNANLRRHRRFRWRSLPRGRSNRCTNLLRGG